MLIHSPLVGPATWAPLVEVFAQRGVATVTPDLDGDETRDEALWGQHVRAAASRLRGELAHSALMWSGS